VAAGVGSPHKEGGPTKVSLIQVMELKRVLGNKEGRGTRKNQATTKDSL